MSEEQVSTSPGVPTPADDDAPTVPLDADGRLEGDAPCRKCGYNLRGLTIEGRCPECRTAVGRSVHGDLLRYCDPEWIDTLAAGMRLFVIAVVSGIGLGLVLGVGLAVMVMTTGGIGAIGLIVAVVGVVAVTAVQLLAYWKVTTPDPARGDEAAAIDARVIARVGLVVSTLLGLAQPLTNASKGGPMAVIAPTSPVAVVVVWMISLVAVVVGLAGMAALFVYGRSLALRLPDDKLAGQTRTVMWGALLTGGFIEMAELVAAAMIPVAADPAVVEAVVAIVVILALLPGLVFWIWGIVLLFKYRNRLRETARQARETWARPAVA